MWDAGRPFPIELDYVVADLMEALRPKMALADSYAEACDAATLLDNQFKAKLGVPNAE